MSKKRVHEIAKELNDLHGIELDNKAVVVELQSLGYDVKSHSSSMDEGEANEALRKIVDKRKPKAAAPAMAAKGFVVRRRVAEVVQSTPQSAPVARPDVPVALAPPPAELPMPPVVAEIPAPRVSVKPPEVASVPVPVAVVAVAAIPETPVVAVVAKPSAPRIRASAPRAPGVQVVVAPSVVVPVAASPLLRTVVAGTIPAARASAPRTQSHVTVRPAVATASGTPVVPLPPHRSLVPTATQAVVMNRPLIAIKRVTPSGPGGRYPMAPGRRPPGTGTGPTTGAPGAPGAVKEFKVVPGPGALPGARDFTRKDERKPTTRKDKDKPETVTTTDIRELLFGRSTIPVRGKKKKPTKRGQKTIITEMAEDKKVIKVQDGITVTEFSQRMGVKTGEIIKKLMAGGKMATANQTIDVDTATIIATDYGWTVKKVGFEVEDFLPKIEAKPEDFISRPPVVTVMGHVDHGKTSLLDAIRKASVASGEAGGITQHVGAYTVKSSKGDITFLDTPGHEAFSAMRARGANITDVVVLVVAADDGVMPQTKEAIVHAQKAEVPIVVAINKMDLPGASPDRVKKELAAVNLLAEDWGGEVIMVPVSAKTKNGLELLLENISLQAEVLELKAHAARPAVGVILEARIEKGRGPIATVLVQEGTLRKGDAIVSGIQFGRVRMMLNDRGELIDEVKPGYSAEVIGLSGVPTAGDTVHAVADEKAAKQIVDHRVLKARQSEAGKTSRESLDDLMAKQKAAEQKELKVVLKADVSGSLEAVADALNKLSTKKVKCTIVQKGVGMMTETDIGTAEAFGAAVLGFNSRPESGAEAAAKQKEVKWATYGIIYEMIDAVTRMMEDLLEPIRTEKKLGKAEVRNLFNVPKLGTIAGSSVTEGTIKRSAHMRLWRANKQIHQGKLASLRRFKDDVKEVGMGYECGIGIEGFADVQAGDVIEAFEIEETRPSLNE